MTLESRIPAASGSRPLTATCLRAGLASALLLALAVACSGGFTNSADLGQGPGAGSTAGGGTDGGSGSTTNTNTDTGSTAGSPSPTTPPADTTCVPLADYFADKMWKPVLSTSCANCHASVPEFTLDPSKDAAAAYPTVVAEAKKNDAGGKSLLLQKPIGEDAHQGRAVFKADSEPHKTFEAFVTAVTGGKDCVANN